MTPRMPLTLAWPICKELGLGCLAGCLSLSGPEQVTGTVGGSLSVQCRYKKAFTDNKKYWCRSPCLSLMRNTVETTESKREVRSGRVSIRDHPENLTFTVTLENLTEGDKGTYWCAIQRPQHERLVDLSFPVVVFVSPGEPHTPSPCPSCRWLGLYLVTPLVRTDVELKSWVSWGSVIWTMCVGVVLSAHAYTHTRAPLWLFRTPLCATPPTQSQAWIFPGWGRVRTAQTLGTCRLPVLTRAVPPLKGIPCLLLHFSRSFLWE